MEEAREILKELGLPSAQQNEISCLTFLALCGIKPNDSWANAYRHSLTVSKGVMTFVAQEYKKKYAPNTRETVRRQVLHQFVQAGVADYNPDDPKLPTNSPRAHYAINEVVLSIVKSFQTPAWRRLLRSFFAHHQKLAERYEKQRKNNLIPIVLSNGKKFNLSPGKHNEIQAAVVHGFAPRFAPGSMVLYLGDTAKKNLYIDDKFLAELGATITKHDKLPDIILFDCHKKWIFLIEVVTSHGPMTPKRVIELEEMFKTCDVGKVFVTAFPDISEFKRHTGEIAWDTEVWIADIPDHMIHFNGDKFIGPR
jgi:hypothetical protein